jgi:hypothetical protein
MEKSGPKLLASIVFQKTAQRKKIARYAKIRPIWSLWFSEIALKTGTSLPVRHFFRQLVSFFCVAAAAVDK